MAGPWEKYQQTSGPWNKYQGNVMPAYVSIPSPEKDVGAEQSALLGALQGGSFGFADEAEAALNNPLGALKTAAGHLGANYSPTDQDVQSYTKSRDAIRKEYETAEAQHPTAYLAGNVGGGIIPALATGGLGLAGEGALGAAKVGALAGGLGGLGSSKATTLGGDVSDIKSGAEGGAITGGVIGAGLGVAKAGAGAVGGLLNDIIESQPAQTFGKAFKQGAKGVKVVGNQAKESIEKNAIDVAKRLGLVAEDVRSGAGEELGGVKSTLGESEKTTDISDVLDNITQKAQDLQKSNLPEAQRDSQKLLSIVNKFKDDPELNFEDLQQLKEDFGALSQKGDSSLLQTQQGTNVATQGATGLRNAIESGFPEMSSPNAKYSMAKQALDILGLDNSSFIKDPITGQMTLHPQETSKLVNLVRQAGTDTSTGMTSSNKLTQALDALNQANPEAASAIRQAVVDAGENLDLAHKANKVGLFNKLGTFQGNLVQAGNRLGLVANKAPEVAAKIVGATPEQITQMAQYVAGLGKNASGAASKVASMATKDSVGRNAVLFSLQQDPNYRKILNDITGVKSNE